MQSEKSFRYLLLRFETGVLGQKGVPNKNAEAVAAALAQNEGNYVVTTDEGREFQTLEEALPEGVVHRHEAAQQSERRSSGGSAHSNSQEGLGWRRCQARGQVGRSCGGCHAGLQPTKQYTQPPKMSNNSRTFNSGCCRTTQINSSTTSSSVAEVSGPGSLPGSHKRSKKLPTPSMGR